MRIPNQTSGVNTKNKANAPNKTRNQFFSKCFLHSRSDEKKTWS